MVIIKSMKDENSTVNVEWVYASGTLRYEGTVDRLSLGMRSYMLSTSTSLVESFPGGCGC